MSAFDRRVDPEVREVQRLEVINGALGRRRWSAEAKARIVAESLAPGVVISEVAGDRGTQYLSPLCKENGGRGAEEASGGLVQGRNIRSGAPAA